MPKPIDTPENLTGQDKVELQAHEPATAKLHNLVASAVKEAFGVERAEMLAEQKRVAAETAQKVLGERAEASKGDSENIYSQKDLETVMRQMMGQQVAPTATKSDSPLRSVAKSAMYLYRAHGNPHIAVELMTKDGIEGKQLEVASKALGVDDFSSGGALLQGEMFDEVVPELLSETALLNDGAINRMPVNGQLTIPYESTGPTTNHTAENADSNASDIAFDQLTLTPNQASVIVAASRKMLSSTTMGAQVIERSMRRSLAVDCDYELIRGVGVSNKPTGLRYLANSSNILTVNATVSAANSVTDLLRLQEAVQNSNVTWVPERSRYALSPRSWRYLAGLRDSDGYVFKTELVAPVPMLNGCPVAGMSGRGISAIPETLSVTDSSETEIYFYSTDYLMLAISDDLRMEMSTEAAYADSSGTVRSAWSRDQAVFKLVWGYDFGSLMRGHDIAVLSDVDWGV